MHTNIGRAPLSQAAVEALTAAAGYVDVEYDVETGARARRGRGTLAALREAVPGAGGALVVNNGAAALVLATTALAAGREVVVSRGEMVEIGDGFRLPDLIASTGARLREVGTTNRTTPAGLRRRGRPRHGLHPQGPPQQLPGRGLHVGGGPAGAGHAGRAGRHGHRQRPAAHRTRCFLTSPTPPPACAQGATVVTASGDKLLGGPQAGLVLGDAETVERLRRHPLARALRVDKLTLAALEATVRGPRPPVTAYLHADARDVRRRTEALAASLGFEVVDVDGAVGGGGAPGLPLPGCAVALPDWCAEGLRRGDPGVVARVERGRCLVDLRCVPAESDADVERAIRAVLGSRG